LILDIEEDKIAKYIDKVANNLTRIKFDKYENVGLVYAENYTSELGNTICNNNPDLDFVMIINLGGKSISFRGTRDDIDLGADIASKFGGGGHPKAAGARIYDSVKNTVTNTILLMNSLGGEVTHI
jgi:nanoRNase/pAp phosphatase (c-di-AMP/oligoRNAs hydrolase)